jgi:hypothetical protein
MLRGSESNDHSEGAAVSNNVNGLETEREVIDCIGGTQSVGFAMDLVKISRLRPYLAHASD